jgi:hypothetical protein
MMLKAVVASVLLASSAPADRHDPLFAEVRDRLTQGVHEACAITEFPGGRKECQALELTVGKHESRFALNVQAGACLPYQCAPIRLGPFLVEFRARSWWQHERVHLEQERWDSIVGLSQEAISQAAILTAERLRSARFQCADADDVIRATLRSYATSRCDGVLPDEDARMATFASIRRKL